jgi:hypothetical protein
MKKSPITPPLDLAAQVAAIQWTARNQEIPDDEWAWIQASTQAALALGGIRSVNLLVTRIERGETVRGQVRAYPQAQRAQVERVADALTETRKILPAMGFDGVALGSPLTRGPGASVVRTGDPADVGLI